MNGYNFKNALFILLFALIFVFSAKNAAAQNSINGLIFDRNRNPVRNIDVELLDQYERFIRSTKTSSAGIYIFQGLRSGVYFVQVRVDGTNYLPSKERIQLGQTNFTNTTTGGISGGEALQLNFVLEIDSRRNGSQTPINNEVIFVQDVPDEAKKAYENALKNLEDKKAAEGISLLQNALKIFPKYYLALDRLGYEFIEQNKFAEAENVFKKALETNSKSFSSKYGLAFAEYKLNEKSEAAKTLAETIVLNPASINSYFLLGKIQRELKQFDEAEKNLKKAKELSKNKVPDIHWELALLYYYNLQKYDEAADELELYLKSNPNAENKEQVKKLIKTFRDKAKQK